MGSNQPSRYESDERISIRAGNLGEVFVGEDGKLVRGVMIAYDQHGREVARGATYREFMDSLRENKKK